MAKQHTPAEIPSETTAPAGVEGRTADGKKGPTPTRREREAANLRPLVPQDRKLAAQQSKEKAREARARANAGMAAGDERYLPVRDKGPQKRYARDVVDARWSVGELLLPVMGVVVVLTFVLPANMATIPLLSIYAFVLAAIVDAYLTGRRVRAAIAARVGADRVERGIRWYTGMRTIQMRPMRLPKPQVKRRANVTFG
ncbi:DUF3043 domain-containing protein [Clavibacter tessellarius]|uniref:DUF3043 domain-containing protein n=1 Tax=Clavibacter tessellarius TaxID=31965 RepID=UPI0039EA65DA